MHVRMTATDEIVAWVYKWGYGPVPIGWTVDGQGLYFYTQTGEIATLRAPGWPVHVLWLPEATLGRAREAMEKVDFEPPSSSLPRHKHALYRLANQSSVQG
jgi:hypothetical protein